jgi:hypothetical protein
MSVGNLKDQGNKGNNFPYQLKTLQLLGAINDGISALPGVDHESRTSTYQATCTICGPGYSNGDIIIRYDIIDLATGLIDTTIWFNDTLQTQLSPAPLPGDLTPVSAPTSVTVLNGPGINAVNIQDGGNSITVDGTVTANAGTGTFAVSAASLPLPTGAATETTLTDVKNNVISKIDRIKGTANYSRTFVYYAGTSNVNTITHTGTTALGAETIIETFTYVNNLVDGSDVTSIIYS